MILTLMEAIEVALERSFGIQQLEQGYLRSSLSVRPSSGGCALRSASGRLSPA